MTGERWQEIKSMLEAVLELDPDKRKAYLDQACTSDAADHPISNPPGDESWFYKRLDGDNWRNRVLRRLRNCS